MVTIHDVEIYDVGNSYQFSYPIILRLVNPNFIQMRTHSETLPFNCENIKEKVTYLILSKGHNLLNY